jgi:hypothetical protein
MLCTLLLAVGAGCASDVTAPGDDDDTATEDDDSAPSDDDEADDDAPPSDDDDDAPVRPKPDGGAAKPPAKSDASTGTGDDKTPPTNGGDEPGDGAGSSEWCKAEVVLKKHCTSCHDGEGTGPMPLLKPEDFKAMAPVTKGKTVAAQSQVRINDAAKPMPPRGQMPAADLKVLNDWLAAGAPAAAGSCAPSTGGDKPDEGGRVDGWDESKCDEIYEVRSFQGSKGTPYTIAAGAEIHPQIRIDAPWGNAKIQAIGFQPITDNKKVLHHWILNGFGRSFLAGWAPGDDARPPFPEDVGMDMPSGAGAFTLDMHYYNTAAGAKPEKDASGVRICALKEGNFRPKLAAVTGSLASIGRSGVLAPRQTARYDATSVCNVTGTEPVHILTAAPHAHRYAIHMKFTVKKKSGQEIVMHDQPWIYGEQGTYPVPNGDVVVEAGDTITTICSYKNETNQDVRFGESTDDEMCFNFALYYPKGALRCGGGLGGIGGR